MSLLGTDVLRDLADNHAWVDSALLADQLRRAAKELDDLRAQLQDAKGQLATACVLADQQAGHAKVFAEALVDARGASVGYWKSEPAEAAQSWIDAQKPGV